MFKVKHLDKAFHGSYGSDGEVCPLVILLGVWLNLAHTYLGKRLFSRVVLDSQELSEFDSASTMSVEDDRSSKQGFARPASIVPKPPLSAGDP